MVRFSNWKHHSFKKDILKGRVLMLQWTLCIVRRIVWFRRWFFICSTGEFICLKNCANCWLMSCSCLGLWKKLSNHGTPILLSDCYWNSTFNASNKATNFLPWIIFISSTIYIIMQRKNIVLILSTYQGKRYSLNFQPTCPNKKVFYEIYSILWFLYISRVLYKLLYKLQTLP